MALFQASVNDANGSLNVNLSSDGKTFTFTETSNYSTSTEVGNQAGDFSLYRKLKVLSPDNVNYIYSSLGDGNILIGAGNAGELNVNYNVPFYGDGVYFFRLLTVPTYNAAKNYPSIGNCVYNPGDGKLYYSKIANNLNHTPNTSPTQWQLVPDEDTLPQKYNQFGSIARVYDLQKCYLQKAVIMETSLQSGQNPLQIPSYLNLLRLAVLLDDIAWQSQGQEWEKAAYLIGIAKSIITS